MISGAWLFFLLACRFVLALSTADSSREDLLILSMSMGRRLGLDVTACASIRIMSAPTTIASAGRLRFRLRPRTFFRKDTMQGGGLRAKASSCLTWSGRASRSRRLGTALTRWPTTTEEGPLERGALGCHGEGMEQPSALLALSETKRTEREKD